MACDIVNAYLNAHVLERICFVAVFESEPLNGKGKACKLSHALFGLKSSGAAWRKIFLDFFQEVMAFKPTRINIYICER